MQISKTLEEFLLPVNQIYKKKIEGNGQNFSHMKRHKRHQINFQTVYISHLVKGTSEVMGTPKITCFLYGVNSNWLVHISKSHCKYTFHRKRRK